MKQFFSLLTLAILAIACSQPQADKVYINAKIWTGDSSNPTASVMAIKGDKIVYVGNDASTYEAAEVIDLQGKRLLPGFTDNHTHFLSAGYSLASVQLKDALTRQEFINRIKAFCKAYPDSTWVLEGSWDHENWGGELPNKEWIDSVTGNHPLFISRYDNHMAFANSKAMELAGITASTVSPDGGVLIKNAKGEPTGIFKDAAMSLINKVIPEPTKAQLDQYFDAAAR